MSSRMKQALGAVGTVDILGELPARQLTLPLDTPRVKVCVLYADSAAVY